MLAAGREVITLEVAPTDEVFVAARRGLEFCTRRRPRAVGLCDFLRNVW